MLAPEPGTYQIVTFEAHAYLEEGDLVVGAVHSLGGYHSSQVVVLRPLKLKKEDARG